MTTSTKTSDGSPFRKLILVPFYVVRIAIYIFYLFALVTVIAFAAANGDDYITIMREYGNTSAFRLIAVTVAIIVVVVLCFVLDIVCIVKHARRTLSHRFFLIVNVVETTIWTVLFILTMISPDKKRITILVQSLIYAAFVGLLIYAAIAFHRNRNVKRYNNVTYEAPPPAPMAYYEPYGQQPVHVPAPPAVGRYEPFSNQPSDASTRKPLAAASERHQGDDRYA